MSFVQRVIDWNVACWNYNGDFKPELEKKLLLEECQEFIDAVDNKQLHEIVDGLADVIFVAVGSLHKLGFDAKTIEAFMQEVCDSNFSKFPMSKNGDGKVQKWPNYTKPNISGIIEML